MGGTPVNSPVENFTLMYGCMSIHVFLESQGVYKTGLCNLEV